MPDLAILFSHFGMNEVAQQNLASFRRSNPDAEILPASFADSIRAGPFTDFFEVCKSNSHSGWANADLLLFNAFLTSRKRYRKWLFVEWDVYCNIPVRKFFKETWKFDVVGPAIATQAAEPEWNWFKDVPALPKKLQPFACGIKPIAVSLYGEDALREMVDAFLDEPFQAFSELRQGTLANYIGAKPVPNPRSAHTIAWRPWTDCVEGDGIFHPIKFPLASRVAIGADGKPEVWFFPPPEEP